MSNLETRAAKFRALHVPGKPVVLFNIWDVGSAKAVIAAGAQALATGSWSVANANGYDDGEALPLDFAIANLARIARATPLPVTIDLESGYGPEPGNVARAVELSISAGAIGCNLEDSEVNGRALREMGAQSERIRAARAAADARLPGYFINARTDVFFNTKTHDEVAVAAVIDRAKAYAEAGANGIFVPGLVDAALIGRLVERSPLPVNVMVSDGMPSLATLASLGVARVSHGPLPYLAAMKALQDGARAAMAG